MFVVIIIISISISIIIIVVIIIVVVGDVAYDFFLLVYFFILHYHYSLFDFISKSLFIIINNTVTKVPINHLLIPYQPIIIQPPITSLRLRAFIIKFYYFNNYNNNNNIYYYCSS